jgi:chromosome partitioning protein
VEKKFIGIKKISEIFGDAQLKDKINQLEGEGEIPESKKFRSGAIIKKGWALEELHNIGEKVGFFSQFKKPVAISVFTTKGGVLKSTLSLNLARTAALHNLKTCVVGLDIQGDVTTALGHDNDVEEGENLEDILEKLNNTKGLSDFFNGQSRLNEIIVPTDLPNLFLIPETPELVAMNDSLGNIHRREFWLREKVIDELKNHFDMIIMDCSPNWNKLITNALVACDVLVSPLECKINNFRNFKVFRQFLSEFKDELRLDFENIFVPTRFTSNRKLSLEIRKWYEENVEGCTKFGVRESVLGEEATALYKSVLEHSPAKPLAKEMVHLLKEIHQRIDSHLDRPQLLDSQNSYYFEQTSHHTRHESRI